MKKLEFRSLIVFNILALIAASSVCIALIAPDVHADTDDMAMMNHPAKNHAMAQHEQTENNNKDCCVNKTHYYDTSIINNDYGLNSLDLTGSVLTFDLPKIANTQNFEFSNNLSPPPQALALHTIIKRE